jgi:hypothetical protein
VSTSWSDVCFARGTEWGMQVNLSVPEEDVDPDSYASCLKGVSWTKHPTNSSGQLPGGLVVTKMLWIPLDADKCSDANLPRPATFASAR